jgi:hypothetical protein
LLVKPTDALNADFIGITTLHISGILSALHQEFLAGHRLWYILCSCDDRLLPGVGWNAVVIPIKLEFSASVGFIHKESYFLSLFQNTRELHVCGHSELSRYCIFSVEIVNDI